MDAGAGEAAHFACGAGFLFSLGALNVLSLEAAARGSNSGGGNNSSGNNSNNNNNSNSSNGNGGDVTAPQHRSPFTPPVDVSGLPAPPNAPIVIFTTRILTAAKQDVVRCIGAHPGASRVTVFCTVSEVGLLLGWALFWLFCFHPKTSYVLVVPRSSEGSSRVT
jgi:hypothetical protein